MANRKKYRNAIGLIAALLLQFTLLTTAYAFCLARENSTIQLPIPGPDNWIVECCDNRVAHWSTSPVGYWIYSGTPVERQVDIHAAVQTWNDIESSYFEMEFKGLTGRDYQLNPDGTLQPVPGAIILGFYCVPLNPPEPGKCVLGGTGAGAVSVGPGLDDFQIPSAIVFAHPGPWTPTPPNPFTVMLHELGHVQGIMHPDYNPHGSGGAGCGEPFGDGIMDFNGGQKGDPGSLELDDTAAATALYPKWKYTVEVVDSSGIPVQGAAIWMEGTCFPHEGLDRFEGGMVFGDIEFCKVGDMLDSLTYHPEITYATGPDGRTGKFRVMHSEFCFTVVADGFVDSYGCQVLPAPGNYITTVILNRAPVCNANSPFTTECQGTYSNFSLDGTASSDPDPDDSLLSYAWATSCSNSNITTPNSATAQLSVANNSMPHACAVSLTVMDQHGAEDNCSSAVTITDTQAPTIYCPTDVTIECDQSSAPSVTGSAYATDLCDASVNITFSDVVSEGTCAGDSTIQRTWGATDNDGNSSTCQQTIEIVDTTPPAIQCNAPASITPSDVPVSFTAVGTDNCDVNPVTEVVSYDCFSFTKKGKRIDRTQTCEIDILGGTINILDSGGIDDHISLEVRSTDSCGSLTVENCDVIVVKK